MPPAAANPIESAASANAINVALRYFMIPPLREVVDVSQGKLIGGGRFDANFSLEADEKQYLILECTKSAESAL
jgi:hypothetical protein